MIASIIILIFSFLLDGIMSYFLNSSFVNVSIFSTIYTVIGITIIYRFFSNNRKYLTLCAIFGLLFDLAYMNTPVLNLFIFVMIGLITIFLNSILSNNIINSSIVAITCICFYHISINIILVLINYMNFQAILLIRILINSLLMTVIYSIILILILNTIDKKHPIKMVK